MSLKHQEQEVGVTDFLNSRYREFALYVLHSRAIPSCIDGFKPSQRKVVWAAGKVCRTTKIKTSALGGAVIQHANYHHGGVDGTASLMAGSWCNNVPILKGEGNFGSRLVNQHAAPRYTFVRLSPEFDRYFLDNDILERTNDPEDPEPRHYLPIIPWVLVNGVNGIAIGYSTEIQPRCPKLLAKICADYVSGRKSKQETLETPLPPKIPHFTGEVFFRDGSWACRGTVSQKSRTQYDITELPVGYDREKYVEFLEKLVESKKIVRYTEACSEGQFRFTVKMPHDHDAANFDAIRFFRLERALSENITTVDETGRLRVFQSAAELLVHFCDYRLKQYDRRRDAWVKRDYEAAELRKDVRRFIKHVINGDVSFKGKTKADLCCEIKRLGFSDDRQQVLLNIRTYEFCEDSVSELTKEIEQLEAQVATWTTTTSSDWFTLELQDITR